MKGDYPILSATEDQLGRRPFADQIASTLRGVSAERGVVVGLMGPWGIGKTSLLNMVIERVKSEDAKKGEGHARTVLQFNPWLFSGSAQLVSAFFEEVGAQLRLGDDKEKKLADKLDDYGQALAPLVFLPVAGVWLSRVSTLFTSTARVIHRDSKPDPVTAKRARIERALADLESPLIVVLDDIDRLTPAEVRDVFRLVRLTADFPRMIYVLVFDRNRVERALGDDAEDGRAYLEKIVQIDFDVPVVARSALERLLLEGLDQVVSEATCGPFDDERWADAFYSSLLPLFVTLREVHRYLAALPSMLATIGKEVALVDVLVLEALRLRMPTVFARLPVMSEALTEVGMQAPENNDQQAQIEAFIDGGGSQRDTLVQCCRVLFPATERYLGGSHYSSSVLVQWCKDRRVASPEVLQFYLSRVLAPGTVAVDMVERAVAVLSNATAFGNLLDALDAIALEDLLQRLEAYEADFSAEDAEPACSILLKTYSRLRSRSRGLLDPGPEIVVDRVMLRLLRQVRDEEQRRQVVESLCHNSSAFTGRIRLLDVTGRGFSQAHERLIPAADGERLFRDVCQQLRRAQPDALLQERDPLWLLYTALAEDPTDRAHIDALLSDDEVAARLLHSAVIEIRSMSLGSNTQGREPVLRWEMFATVVGDEEAINSLLERLTARMEQDLELAGAAELARRYLGGWRPPALPSAGTRLVVRPPLNSPHSIFSPGLSTKWPALLVRALTTYAVDSLWAANADVGGGAFHQQLMTLLSSTSITDDIMRIASSHGLMIASNDGSWQLDPDSFQSSRMASVRLLLTSEDGVQIARVRYTVSLPDPAGPMRLLADIYISPSQETDPQWTPISVREVCDLLTSALSCVVGPLETALLPAIFEGEVPQRRTVELYLAAPAGSSTDRPGTTLSDTIDMEPLGTCTRLSQAPSEGSFAVAGSTDTSTPARRRELVLQGVERIARDWGYCDAQHKDWPV